jgi:hypothetical protein
MIGRSVTALSQLDGKHMASIRKRGSSWQAQVRREGYPPLSKSLASKADAMAWARDKERSIDRAELPTELWRILGDEADQAALCAGIGMTSMPSRNLTPAITFGNWFLPISRRQVFEAAITSLNTISRAVVEESEPLVRTVR